MDKEESLALFAQGKDAWNAWADEMIARRRALEESGVWNGDDPFHDWNEATRTWQEAATANFEEHAFEGLVQFSGFHFPGPAQFAFATFEGTAAFGGSKFGRNANFFQATFGQDASFADAIFEGNAQFQFVTVKGIGLFHSAIFKRDVWFKQTTFESYAAFDQTTFGREAEFGEATFGLSAGFTRATFTGTATFGGTAFKGDAAFDEATFKGDAEFDRSSFERLTSFQDTHFEANSNFAAIQGKSAFSLAGATFNSVPDFIQAQFAEPPRLDQSRIEAGGLGAQSLAGIMSLLKGDPDRSARWRALKLLANRALDHDRELVFFKNELKARRWSVDRPYSVMFWFGLLYEWLSDYGRSFLRPLFWWAVGVAVFACLYIGHHPALEGKPLAGFALAADRVVALFGGNTAAAPACVTGPGDPVAAALALSGRNALVFAGAGFSDKLNQIYACLYGVHGAGPTAPDRITGFFIPVIPDAVAFLSAVQIVYSTIMIFLLLLAIRNHFRIK